MADWNCNICKEYKDGLACTYCDDGSEFVRMTNADLIRAMSDEELAYFLYGIDHYCDDGQCIVTFGLESLNDNKSDILEWLQSEAEEPHD